MNLVILYLLIGFVVAAAKGNSLIKRRDEVIVDLETNPILPDLWKSAIFAIAALITALVWPIALIRPVIRLVKR